MPSPTDRSEARPYHRIGVLSEVAGMCSWSTLVRPAVKTSTWWNAVNAAGHRDAGGSGA
ncbi:hypothetical protein QRX60_13765 [Amycolatopsis mongoliensis]|uniref:Uncharacterized protein n=1 Tax=Amycolatopsis mongoliensis TaxID=715475 RepID=A0A9Y2JVS3_9PSEU|nr:hypothetical protein [Amycolatopsis sp. 4-36]WIY04855.1 hypothetical protein QRX60_13765 [Amycolatopsis sp. 4-36]